jgi:hypothetical protein
MQRELVIRCRHRPIRNHNPSFAVYKDKDDGQWQLR